MLINELWFSEAMEYELAKKEDIISKLVYNLQQNLGILRLLLQNGANMNARNDYGMTPLFQAYKIDCSQEVC